MNDAAAGPTTTVAVIGQGYVGLPLAVRAERGFADVGNRELVARAA